MNNIKRITIAGYTVEYIDLREPKPRKIYTETAVFDTGVIAAANALRIEFTDYIRRRYERDGYHVLTISKASRRECFVDLDELYQLAGQGGAYAALGGQEHGQPWEKGDFRMKTHNNATADRIIEILLEEINYVLKRNKTEEFLRSVLTRALILEELRTEARI